MPGSQTQKTQDLLAPFRLIENRISEAGVCVGRQLLAVAFERERDPGAVAQMRHAHDVEGLRELVEIEELFLALHAEGGEPALPVVEVGVGYRGVEAPLPSRALRRNVEASALAGRHLTAVADAHRQQVRREIVDVAPRN